MTAVFSTGPVLIILWLLVGLGSAVGPPKQVSPHQARQVAKVGQSKKKFPCPVSADPPPIFIQWLKDGDPVSDVWTRFRVNKDGSLRIKDIELEDAGKYVCKATNGFGSIMVNYSLIVVDKESGMVKMDNNNLFAQDDDEDFTKEGGKMKTKPVLIGPHPQNESVILGGVASFQCKVKSVVQPHIQWLKRLDSQSGEVLNNSSAIIEVKGQKFVVLKTGEVWKDNEGFYLNKLIIRKIAPSDTGMYICLGANTMGYSFRSAFLTVSTEPVAPKDETKKTFSIGDSYSIDNNKNKIPASSSSSQGSSDSDSSNGSLPLMIAIPAGVAIIAVTIAIYILQRRRCCNSQSNTHRTTRFNPVPTQERENLPTPVHTNPHMLSSAATSSRTGDKVSNNRSLDFYSDISSVSRCHHQQQHNNLQYGY